MSYNSIRISRQRGGFEVRCTDPAIEEANRQRDKSGERIGEWKDPEVEFPFETKEQVLEFIDKAIDTALPAETFTSAFDKFAKEAQGI